MKAEKMWRKKIGAVKKLPMMLVLLIHKLKTGCNLDALKRHRTMFYEKIHKIHLVPIVRMKKKDQTIPTPGEPSSSDFSTGVHSMKQAFETSKQLSTLSKTLEDVCKNSEPQFMQIGQDLQSIYTDAVDLTDRTLAAVDLIGGGSGEGALSRVGDLVSGALDEIKCRKAEATEDAALLDTHVDAASKHLRNNYTLCREFKKTGMYIRAIGLNIRIESSRSTHTMEMFDVVSGEIGSLSNRFREIAEHMREDSASARADLIRARRNISGNLDELFNLVDEAEQAVKDARNEIEQIMTASVEAFEEAGRQSQAISRQVGEIVMGIQFHDNMRQRIEHINESLLEVQRRCSDAESSHETGDAGAKSLYTAYSILDLQKAQMRHLIVEINGVYERSRHAFEALGSDVGKLSQVLSVLGEKTSGALPDSAGECQDPFDTLKAALRQLYELIDNGVSIVDRIRGQASQASETVICLSSYTDRLKKIGFETRLIALNALIKTEHLGEKGMTLNRLAEEVTKISMQSDVFVAGAEKIQNLITRSAQVLETKAGKSAGERPPEDKKQVSPDEIIEDISRTFTQFRKDSSSACLGTDHLNEAILKTHAGLAFIPAMAAEVTRCEEQLDEISQALSHWGNMETELAQVEINEILRRYTVQEERDIHEQLMDGSQDICLFEDEEASPEDSPASAAVLFDEEDGDDFGDNIELF